MATQIDLGAVVPIGKGDWNIGTTYERANIVRHNSVAWICKVDSSTGVEPTEDSSDWYLLVKDTSSVTSVNGQRGDVNLDIISPNDIMVGASDEISGKSGLVPKPEAGDNVNKFLKADGTWKKIDLEKYLPLTGGTLIGPLTIVDWGIRKYDASGQTGLQFFNPTDSSAYFWLNNTKHASNPGGFMLAASNGSTTKRLQGEMTGKLLWDSKNIVRSVNGIDADANGNVNAPYLPLTGGTMTGAIRFSQGKVLGLFDNTSGKGLMLNGSQSDAGYE